MRIGLNALAVSPTRPGGDVTYVLELARRLPTLDPAIDWRLFVLPEAVPLFGPLPANVRVIPCPVPSGSIIARALYEQTALVPIALMQHLDVLFAPVNVLPIAYPGRTVLTLHEAEPFMPDTLIPLPLVIWWRVMRSLSARRADRILTVSYAARQQISQWMHLPEGRLDVVHLGVDVERFSPAARQQPHPLNGQPYILWVGRPYPRKNLGVLLDAYAELRRRGRTELLVLIGPPGWKESALRARIAQQFPPNTVLRLPANWSDLPRWYAHARVFVFPSTQETFGLPVLEALACHTPVVAADIPALREIGSKAANYVSPRDPWLLGTGLIKQLDSAELGAHQNGFELPGDFTWSKAAEEVLRYLLGL
jgi:glycosyltransferase involved in cell wall biosynthesis